MNEIDELARAALGILVQQIGNHGNSRRAGVDDLPRPRERVGRLSVEGVEMRMRVDHLRRRRRELPPGETAGQPA